MNLDELIEKILKATYPLEVFTIKNYKKEYLEMVKLLHPDVCHHPKTNDVLIKLNELRRQLEEMLAMEDDAGTLEQIDEKTVVFMGDKSLLQHSYEQYQRLSSFTDEASLHFRKYLPLGMSWKGDHLVIHTKERIVSLLNRSFPQRHVTWMASRMFELVAWFHQVGMCHAGISPSSLFVVPKTHGIICASFYHMVPLHTPLQTISAKYADWYPSIVFSEKKAIPYVDLSLVQRTALYLLGDKSGNGVKLKSKYNQQLIDFFLTPHYHSFETFDQYRKLLTKLFGKPTFFPLDI